MLYPKMTHRVSFKWIYTARKIILPSNNYLSYLLILLSNYVVIANQNSCADIQPADYKSFASTRYDYGKSIKVSVQCSLFVEFIIHH